MNAPDFLNGNDALTKKLRDIVLQNLDNNQFGVSELSRLAGISRSQLHRKLKILKNQSVSQFIKDVRLQEAIKLLQHEDLTVAEVAYRVGFSCPNYFHRCFQIRYGYAPGNIKRNKSYLAIADKKENDRYVTLQNISRLMNPKKMVVLLVFLLSLIYAIYHFASDSFTQKSIAVLPLQNFTGEPEQDFFVKGFHDALIGNLGQISGMRVISRTSTLQYEALNVPLKEVARELQIDFIVEGSLFASGDKTYIQLQLIEVFPKERHIWSKRYLQDFENLLIIQNEIVKNITLTLSVPLTTHEEKLLATARIVNQEAYKAYLKGMFYWDQLNEEGFNKAIEYFQLALDHDPDYAPAYAGISLVWTGRLQEGLISHAEVSQKLKSAARKALDLDNSLSEVHYALGIASCWVDWNYEKAEQELKLAIAGNPNDAKARAYLAHILLILNKPEEAMEQIALASGLDPFNPLLKSLKGMYLNFTRQYDAAIDTLIKTLENDPYESIALSTLKTSYHMKEMYPQAFEIWKTACLAKDDFQAVEVLKEGYKTGGYSCALENLAQLLIDRSQSGYITPWQIATLYTRAGNREKAIFWLEKAYEAHDNNMPYIGIDPIFDYLRDDTRFQNLLQKTGLQPADKPV